MSQYPGGDPGQQPWGSAPQPDPRATPGAAQQGPYQQQPGPGGYPAPQPYPSQPGYGQPGYPAPPGYTGPGPAQPGFAPQPGYPAPQGWGQQPANPPQPAYGYQQPYAATPYQPVPVATGARSPVLGFIALAVVLLATLGSLAGGWLMVQDVQRFLATAVYTNGYSSDELQQVMTGSIGVLGIAATAGFAGWVAGIVAAATNRGRVAGVIAIIVGVLAPFAIWGYIGLSLASIIQQYQ